MNKVAFIDVVISNGYNKEPAVRFNDESTVFSFRFGDKIYDPKAENNTRWLNMTAKGFGNICKTVQKMKLSGGSHVTMFGKLTEEEWTDSEGELKRRQVFVADEIFYASGGKKSESDTEPAAGKKKPAKEEEGEFTGFEKPGNFGSFYDE